MKMDEDCRQRFRDYQALLGEDYAGLILGEPNISFQALFNAHDIIRAHGLGISTYEENDV
jgi:hypothetical protein